jgi:KDO2-lipid IV(A) lauroyltransferase
VKLTAAVNRRAGSIAARVLPLMRHIELSLLANFTAWCMCEIGPWLPEHRIARANLAAAYPEKSAAQVEQIVMGMWDNFGRLAAEYAHLDLLWDHDPLGREPRRIEIAQASTERLLRLRDDEKPALVFFAHQANFELIGVVGSAHGLELGLLERRPHNRDIADALVAVRARAMPTLARTIQAGPGAALEIKKAIQAGAHVVMVVDQHFERGVDVTFFGRCCKVNPALAKFARMFECPIHGARVTRLPGNRFRYELTEAIEPPRDARGKIEVAATMQVVTSLVESWVREHPEQWNWAHRRWQ